MCAKTSKHFSREEKRVAFKLWRAKYLSRSSGTKSRCLSPLWEEFGLCQKKSRHFGCWPQGWHWKTLPHKQNHTEGHEEEAAQFPKTTVMQLKKTVPGLANISMRAIQLVTFKFSALTGHVLLRRLYIWAAETIFCYLKSKFHLK